MLRSLVGAGDLPVSHIKAPVRDVLLESIELLVILPGTRMLNTSGPALGDIHCSLGVDCHHLAENLGNDSTLSRGATFLFDLASLSAFFQGLLYLLQVCVLDFFIDDICSELDSFGISHIPETTSTYRHG